MYIYAANVINLITKLLGCLGLRKEMDNTSLYAMSLNSLVEWSWLNPVCLERFFIIYC